MKKIILLSLLTIIFTYAEESIIYSPNYQKCLDNSGGVTVAMRTCNVNELTYQDALLNINYKLAMNVLDTNKKSELKKVQREWIKYRDIKCDFLDGLTGGTMDIAISDGCVVDMTALRAQELSDISSMFYQG